MWERACARSGAGVCGAGGVWEACVGLVCEHCAYCERVRAGL